MNDLPSTYFVYDRRHDKEELRRLAIQDQMVTAAMGGVLSEQPDPTVFHHVLDIGCGTGGWIIAAAKTYPGMSLVGIDISHRMAEHTSQQAKASKVSNQVEFQVMDALRPIEFTSASFDLVNLRFGVSFIRKWEWPYVISEMLRVTKPGGVVRITDSDIVQHSNSIALKMFQEMVWCALHRAGHLFEEEALGITPHLASLLKRYGVRDIQTKAYTTMYQADKIYIENICYATKTLKPFIQRWGCTGTDYEQICQLARGQINRPDFYAIWQLLTAWGVK